MTVCKDKDNKIGIRVRAINNGIFVCLVVENSPAALVGIRFGDQILQINGTNVAGFSMDKVHDILKKSPVNGINIAVRDRPFERTLTLHKDSTGHVGFQFKNGRIVSIVKDSSAAKNGVLTDHQLLEVDGRNVVGLKDKEVTKLIDAAGNVVTITVIPSFVYEHMVKKWVLWDFSGAKIAFLLLLLLQDAWIVVEGFDGSFTSWNVNNNKNGSESHLIAFSFFILQIKYFMFILRML